MQKIYASPLRVYLSLAILALAGIYSGLKLPVSLFPNSSKPTITAILSYGNSTPAEFLNSYGRGFEGQLRAISSDSVQVEKLKASYRNDSAKYEVEFKWGTSPADALKEVQLVANSYAARLPEEIRDSLNIWNQNENTGFLAVSFYSQIRSLDALYDVLEPVIVPQISKVKDATEAVLYNPSRKEVRVELDAQKMASLQLLPHDIDRAVSAALSGYGGGSVMMGTQQLSIQLPRPVQGMEDLGRVTVPTPSGRPVHLSEIARIDLGPRTSQSQSFKTNGAPSLILFATPKPGGNVKRMSEEMVQIVKNAMPTLPKDIEYRILVDPSEFIRASIHNVFHEVAIGALLAVAILFLFIGSFKNTVTAAIEIPMSMVLAFILMRLSGMNLNLISLGGLALSAGMNVDASVVVMENIFRHFENASPKMSFEEKLSTITRAVAEVRFAVIASTIASLVVFLPLAFTSDLSYAILGDLAKTVVFSHGFSAFVALLLVPTVRLHLMRKAGGSPVHSPIEGQISRLERAYGSLLGRFIAAPKIKQLFYGSLAAILGLLVAFVLPSLPKEVIGRPDTDWMVLSINTKGNTLTRQMESQAEEIETRLLNEFGSKIAYTFTQTNGANNSTVMARLKNKGEMREVWKAMEERFTNTPFLRYWVGPWNPAELPIPDPAQLQLSVLGGSTEERAAATEEVTSLLEEKQVLPRIWSEPNVSRTESIFLKTNPEQWSALRSSGRVNISPPDIADLARVATFGRRIGSLSIRGKDTDIFLRYPEGTLKTPEDLGNLPIGIDSKLVPLKALAQIKVDVLPPTIVRENERELFSIFGRQSRSSEGGSTDRSFMKKAEVLVADWNKARAAQPSKGSTLLYFEDAERELTDALHQLGIAVALSVALIFLTLVIQFGDIMSAALVLVAVPLGFIGVLISLFVFRSTLSLNSVLGVILLNGIAVANSIILVDFLKRLVAEGLSPREAAVTAARKRLRPILITSLTTILGMLPIAIGMGEGGRILQPLGIAVSGGLWVSMGLTLFVVPALQVSYLEWRMRRESVRHQSDQSETSHIATPDPVPAR